MPKSIARYVAIKSKFCWNASSWVQKLHISVDLIVSYPRKGYNYKPKIQYKQNILPLFSQVYVTCKCIYKHLTKWITDPDL